MAINYCTSEGKYLYIDDITIESESVGIDNAVRQPMSATVQGNTIIVQGCAGQTVSLFDVAGRLVAQQMTSSESVRFVVPARGAYLVKAGTMKPRKVIVF